MQSTMFVDNNNGEMILDETRYRSDLVPGINGESYSLIAVCDTVGSETRATMCRALGGPGWDGRWFLLHSDDSAWPRMVAIRADTLQEACEVWENNYAAPLDDETIADYVSEYGPQTEEYDWPDWPDATTNDNGDVVSSTYAAGEIDRRRVRITRRG